MTIIKKASASIFNMGILSSCRYDDFCPDRGCVDRCRCDYDCRCDRECSCDTYCSCDRECNCDRD